MKNKKKECCIACGKFNRKFCMIISSVLASNILSAILIFIFIGYIANRVIEGKTDYQPDPITYLFFLNLCESLTIIPGIIYKKKYSTSLNKMVAPKEKSETIEKYIFNQRNSVIFSKREIIYLFLFAILKFFIDLGTILYMLYLENDNSLSSHTFQFELIFLFLLSKLLYKTQFYKHQYIAVIILSTIALAKLLIKYINKETNFFYHLIIHIILSFFISLKIVYTKGLMDYKFLTPYKICYIFGIFNFCIVTFIFIIVSFIPCETYCFVEYNGSKYFANIRLLFIWPSAFIFCSYIINTILVILNYFVIRDYSVLHSFLLIHFSQIFELSEILNFYKNIYFNIFLLVFSLLFGTFLILLFLEVIEINICKISYNTRKNISKRAFAEIENSKLYDDDDDSEEEEEDEQTEKEEMEEKEKDEKEEIGKKENTERIDENEDVANYEEISE